MLHLNFFPDKLTQTGSGYGLRDVFVTLVSISGEGFLLPSLGGEGEVPGF